MQMTKREIEKLRKLRALAALAACADVAACNVLNSDAEAAAYAAVALGDVTNAYEDNAGDEDGTNTFKESLDEYQNAPTYRVGVLRLDKALENYNAND